MTKSCLFVFYMLIVASYIANTSQLVPQASKHSTKNEKSFVHNRKKHGIQNPVNAVTFTYNDRHHEPRTAGGSTYLENRIRLKEPSLDNLIHNIDKTGERYRTRRGKKRNVRYFRYGTITLASKQPATLYRNGKRLLDIRRTYGGYRFTRNIKIYFGDLLAVESMRNTRQYGVAVDLRLKVVRNEGRRISYVHYNTHYEDGSRMWRGDGIPRKRWTTKRKQYCKLPRPTKVRNAQLLKPRVKNAPPLDPKTRYVWVSDGKTSRGKITNYDMEVPKTAYLILEVGLKCSHRPQYRRAPPRRQSSVQGTKPRSSTSSMNCKLKPEEDAYPPQCKCRAYPQSKRSVCYSMLKPGKPQGRCRRRQCGVSYECIPGGGRGLLDCVRHAANYEVVLMDNSKGVLRCSYRKLREPKIYYTMYG